VEKHPPKVSVSAPKPPKNKKYVVFILVAVLAGIPFSLGKYIELSMPGPWDSGAYVYSAKHILEGAQIGVEEKPSAQPGTLLVNIIGVGLFGFNDTGPKLIQMLLQAAALVLMFVAMRRLFGTLAAAVAVIIASTYLSAPLLAKFGNVKEQYMIAFMVMGMSCFVLYQLGGKWWLCLLAGAFVAWGPLFKQTGMSAIAAIGLFVLAQPVLRRASWKRTGTDILLLFAGAGVGLLPVYIWLASIGAPVGYWPYSFASKPIVSAFEGGGYVEPENQPLDAETDENEMQEQPEAKKSPVLDLLPDYVRGSWEILSPEHRKEPALRVLRYYWLLILPIFLAASAVLARLTKGLLRRAGKLPAEGRKPYDKFVLLFAVWWFFDMAFVWVSPRSYEQYYLPLNASAAMLGGYLIALYSDKLRATTSKKAWLVAGLVGFWVMIFMSWHVFFGVEKSPYTGRVYGGRQRGYLQRLQEAAYMNERNGKQPWQRAGEYIRQHSTEQDKMYVWGWYPGIYVAAQRLSPAPKAFEGSMHIISPQELSRRVKQILDAFEKEPPKFIVDTRKRHFPGDRPAYELWPIVPKIAGVEREGFVPQDEEYIVSFNKLWMKILRENYGQEEAERYEAMAPFREYIRQNYSLAEPRQYAVTNSGKLLHRMFGEHIVFQRKDSPRGANQ
jgi:4-amino-4-deoxy-L-arabinose transferase-like glycosyltransferase